MMANIVISRRTKLLFFLNKRYNLKKYCDTGKNLRFCWENQYVIYFNVMAGYLNSLSGLQTGTAATIKPCNSFYNVQSRR